MYKSSTAGMVLNGKNMKAFPLTPGIRQGLPTLTTDIQHSTGSSSQSN